MIKSQAKIMKRILNEGTTCAFLYLNKSVITKKSTSQVSLNARPVIPKFKFRWVDKTGILVAHSAPDKLTLTQL